MATEDQGENTEQPNEQGSGDEGSSEKLFFGKYKSLEEAEKGYKELEQGFHAKAQEAAQYREVADRAQVYRGPEGDYGHGGTYVPASNPADAAQELSQLYADPVGWKRKVQQEAVLTAAQVIARQQNAARELEGRFNAWRERNPDIQGHEDFLTPFVNQTDPRLAPEARLDLAAMQLRRRLAEVRGTGASREANGKEFVDGTGGERQSSRQRSNQQAPASQEDALSSYVASRNRTRIKRPGMKQE